MVLPTLTLGICAAAGAIWVATPIVVRKTKINVLRPMDAGFAPDICIIVSFPGGNYLSKNRNASRFAHYGDLNLAVFSRRPLWRFCRGGVARLRAFRVPDELH